MSSLATINLDNISLRNQANSKSKISFVRSYQDFLSLYIPEGTGTKLIVIMRVDLGRDIPRWIFLATIAATGLWSVRALKRIVEK